VLVDGSVLDETEASGPADALPVWNVPCDVAIDATTVWAKRSHVGVKDPWPVTGPCVTLTVGRDRLVRASAPTRWG
jgi:hypothetical protein